MITRITIHAATAGGEPYTVVRDVIDPRPTPAPATVTPMALASLLDALEEHSRVSGIDIERSPL